jgi:ATP-dependent helicase HrpB
MHAYPVLEVVPQLLQTLATNNIAILQAPPGAGKSTIVPLELLKATWLSDKKAVMLEPRRLAAKSVAQRMASLLAEDVGDRVGYRVRFDTKVSAVTKLEVVTEGILTRMMQRDNSLEDIGLVIFDEFHERSLQADLALALCLQVQSVLRPDLRILIMSATLDADALTKVLGKVPVITSDGRLYPIEVHYLNAKEDEPLVQRTIAAVRRALRDEQGDVLVFLPGAGEILRTAEGLAQLDINAQVHTLYADLSYKQQEEALLPNPAGMRKVVLATSIAETSLTIEGVKVVIDSGYARVPSFDTRSGLTRLETVRVTTDAADQRKGRAGRLGPGVCYRLWTANLSLVPQRKPEILEADLAPMVLELMQWGIKDLNDLVWITKPPSGAWSQAIELLEQLHAIQGNAITEQGKAMLKLPTHPRIAHMLATTAPQQQSIACDLAAIIEERDPLPKEAGTDVALRLEALQKFRNGERYFADRSILVRIEKVANQWRNILKTKVNNYVIDDFTVGQLLATVYPERIAQQLEKNGERYKLANGRIVKLPPHDSLAREPWLCIAQLDAGHKEGKVFLAAALHEQNVNTLAQTKELVEWDDTREMIAAYKVSSIGSLVVGKRPLQKPNAERMIEILCDKLREKGLKFINWDEQHIQWQARLSSLKQWRTNDDWPDVSEEYLLQTANEWLAPYLTGIYKRSELLKLDLLTILQSSLPWELAAKVNTFAPQKIQVPSGSMIALQYFADARPPVMEVRLQEMFGLLETPTVNEGKTKIMLHLLSPGYKPVQVTQDLKSFWQHAYHEVRKELRMRYPRHHWPEDPWTAEAVRGAKRRTS